MTSFFLGSATILYPKFNTCPTPFWADRLLTGFIVFKPPYGKELKLPNLVREFFIQGVFTIASMKNSQAKQKTQKSKTQKGPDNRSMIFSDRLP
jgi:hypothetical protein